VFDQKALRTRIAREFLGMILCLSSSVTVFESSDVQYRNTDFIDGFSGKAKFHTVSLTGTFTEA